MGSTSYHVTTEWLVKGTREDVATIFHDADSVVRWWPATWLRLDILDPGDENAVGRVVAVHTKGFLPYTLRFQFRVVESLPPSMFSIQTWGDFIGRARCDLAQLGQQVRLRFDWDIRVAKPSLRRSSWLLKPLFVANHRWTMRRGKEGLQLEIARRRATTAEELSAMPRPRPPTFPHNLLLRR